MKPKDIARRARHLWTNPDMPAHTNRHNRRAYIRSVLFLGSKWVLSESINGPTNPAATTWRKP